MAGSSSVGIHDEPLPRVGHVLHVADCDVLVRFGRMFRQVALALDAEGVHVSLVTDDLPAVADLEGTPAECHWFHRLSGWLAWRLAHDLARDFETLPDVVHLWGTAGLASVGSWALQSGIPVLVHALSERDASRLLERGARANLRCVAACAGLLRSGPEHLATGVDRFRVVPPALLMPDVPDEDPLPPHGHTLGVLWAGRFDQGSGLATLIDALAQLRRRNCDLQAVLVGTGPAVRAVRGHIQRAGVQSCISLIDEPRLWDRVMHGADVYVVPARQAELSLAPLLAMALGKVVVASRDQVADWFIEDQTTWQFTPGSAVELAYHLARVADGERVARELGRSAMKYVAEHHNISRVVTSLVAEYRMAADAGAPGRPGPVKLNEGQP
jgi:glycosyltransferase involved in cell wall biosynthesis